LKKDDIDKYIFINDEVLKNDLLKNLAKDYRIRLDDPEG
jgi:hypothetical protein